jgi:LysM repeat protein
MRKISLWLFIFALTASLGRAQETATQQQIDKLSGQIQDLLDAQAQQNKRLDAMEKEISDLGEKINQPVVNNSASVDDLKKLASQVQEIDQNRQNDKELILKQLEKLGQTPATKPSHRSVPAATTTDADNGATPAPTGPQNGHPYTIAAGDTLAAIAKAYRAQGVKVTTKDILAANPGLDANKLYVGKKIFIPDPAAK